MGYIITMLAIIVFLTFLEILFFAIWTTVSHLLGFAANVNVLAKVVNAGDYDDE